MTTHTEGRDEFTSHHNACHNAAQIAGRIKRPCMVNNADLVAYAAVAMHFAESDPSLMWDGGFDSACDEVAELIDRNEQHILNLLAHDPQHRAKFKRDVHAITLKHMIPRHH